MMNEHYIEGLVGTGSFVRGKRLYEDDHVGDLDVTEDPQSGIISIDAEVESSHWNEVYSVHIMISSDNNWVLDSECTCPYFETNLEPCKHVAAVLLKYINDGDSAMVSNAREQSVPVRNSDAGIRDLLSHYTTEIQEPGLTTDPVHLQAFIDGEGNKKGSMSVEFKIGVPDKHMYVLQNLGSFCELVKNNERKKYGKALDFIHNEEAFDVSSRPLLHFLMSLYDKEDSYADDNNYYYNYSYYYSGYNTSNMKRNLSLRGRYLDDFMNAIRNTEFHVNGKYPNGTYDDGIYTLMDQDPQLSVTLQKSGNGYLFSGDAPEAFEGNSYLYFIDSQNHRILRSAMNRELLPVLDYLANAQESPAYISDKDLPAFAKYVYPQISTHMLVKSDGFDPLDYTPKKPDYEIYLDLPQEDLITGELYAVYPDAKYNVLEGIEDNGRRDIEDEQKMDTYLTSWFNSFDPVNKNLALSHDDDKTYRLLTDGIPALQQKGTVFISDRLKKLTVRKMPKVTAGISVSHDLLRLDLVSDTMPMNQLAEILSRYDRRKKYYRLKNGEFLEVDDSVRDLMNLRDSLDLSTSDIKKGSVELPRYRAMYLDEMAENDTFDIDRDTSFRRMIQHMKDADGSEYDPPEDLQATLRPYQLDGFRWLSSLRDNGFDGLLADEMGLGKTLEVIAFLGAWKTRKRALVICPASLVYNWSSEIHRFLPSMHSVMIQGPAADRKELIRNSGEQDVLITSYDLIKRDLEYYEGMQFSCEVIDEAQYIKNASTQAARAVKAINSVFRIALTGTPIENRLSELWSIFDYLMPGFFHSYKYFRDHYEIPIIRDEDDLTERDLTRMITPFVLRRLKKDVLKDLPDKLEEVYYAQLDGEQKDLYTARVQRLKLMLDHQTDQEFKENKIMVLSELTRLRQICCDPGLVYENYNGNSAKEDLCIDMVKNAVDSGHKILLFSQFTTMLEEITKRLDEEQIHYHLLEGSTPKKQRAEMVESFQHDDVPVFCISLKAGGTGLNLTAADIVIHYDPWWNTAVENQATDRAHRIGQKNVVSVYRLIMKDTIEERILELQNEKSDLAGRVLSGEGISSSRLSREDLLSLL